jgi:hypothetical protein
MPLLREKLIEQYQELHLNEAYGASGEQFRLHIQTLIAELRPKSILNYGCGQSRVHEKLELLGAQFFRYDPAIEDLSSIPVDRADLVINTDVLEHIPESDLDDVLANIASISDNVFFNIATRLAKNWLPDGRNPHCTIKSTSEWKTILQQYFPEVRLIYDRPGHSCSFLTWNSCLLEVVAGLEELPIVREQLAKARESLLTKTKKEIARVRKKVSGKLKILIGTR